MYIEVENGVRIFVQDINPGEGSRPVVFAHGWPANHKTLTETSVPIF